MDLLRKLILVTLLVLFTSEAGFCIDGNDLIIDEAFDATSGGFPSDQVDALGTHSHAFRSDLAFVSFFIDEVGEVAVWMQTDLCIGCKLVHVANLTSETPARLRIARIDTRWATRIKVTTLDASYPTDDNVHCELYYHFGLFGEYNLTVPSSFQNASNVTECGLTILKGPIFANTAIIVGYGTAAFIFFCAGVWICCIKKRVNKNSKTHHNGTVTNNGLRADDEVPLTVQANTNNPTASTRIRSVDAFRGFALWNLICGTSGDGQYWYVTHARWYGITIADFMFPWFVFIMGTSIHLAFNILLSKGKPMKDIFKKIVIRSIVLFLLGVCLQRNNDLRTLRIPGVLQRFGITYFVVASSYLFSRWLLMKRRSERTGKGYRAFCDIVDYLELPLAACCLVVHLCITFLLPVPGCPRGYQGPGGPLVGEDGELTNCTGGAAGYIDRLIFTEAHLIGSSTCKKVYHTTLPHDPEGILGTLTSIALCIFGLQAGKILQLFDTVRGRTVRLVTWGLLLIACAAVLTKCHMADGWIPLNKNLWSVSYIALTGGIAFLIQALCHVLIDVTRVWNGAPLFYLGMNSILLYLGAFVLSGYLPFSWKPFVANHAEYACMAAWSMVAWLLVAYILYKKKIFLKL